MHLNEIDLDSRGHKADGGLNGEYAAKAHLGPYPSGWDAGGGGDYAPNANDSSHFFHAPVSPHGYYGAEGQLYAAVPPPGFVPGASPFCGAHPHALSSHGACPGTACSGAHPRHAPPMRIAVMCSGDYSQPTEANGTPGAAYPPPPLFPTSAGAPSTAGQLGNCGTRSRSGSGSNGRSERRRSRSGGAGVGSHPPASAPAAATCVATAISACEKPVWLHGSAGVDAPVAATAKLGMAMADEQMTHGSPKTASTGEKVSEAKDQGSSEQRDRGVHLSFDDVFGEA